MNLDLNNIYQGTVAKKSNHPYASYIGTVKYLCYINYVAQVFHFLCMLFRLFKLTYIKSVEVNIIRHRL